MMKAQRKQGVSRKGLDVTLAEEEAHKSNLILEANLLKAQGRYQDAADRFAEAAQIEERLSEMLLQKGLLDKYFVHRFSALSCWAQAGNIYYAIVMGEELLARADLPERLRQRIQEHVQLLRVRRVRWFSEFAPRAVAATASQ
jgi:tetratricopeptide (TPR) repeat protein